MEDATKQCGKCGESLPLDSYHLDRRRKDGLYPWCKECRRAYYGQEQKKPRKFPTKALYDVDYRARMTASERRERNHRSWMWTTYRLTPEDYQAMLDSQGGVCAICGGGPGQYEQVQE